MCTWCNKDADVVPMVSGAKMPMVCSECGTRIADFCYELMRAKFKEYQTKIALLERSLNIKDRIVYIDMDGVICNYKDMVARMKKLVPSKRFPQAHEDFWIHLKPIEGAIEAVNKLRESYNVYILSGPSTRNPGSYSGKRIWMENHFDMDMCERLILCNNKGLLMGDYLIDDNHKGKGQENFKGERIYFGGSEYPTWKEVLGRLL